VGKGASIAPCPPSIRSVI